MKIDDRSHEETEARHGTLPKTCTSSKKKTKLRSTRPRESGYSRLRQQKRRSEQKWNPVRGSTVYTRTFRRTQNCDICLKTKIKRASCRRRAGTVVPRAEHFGDLITADHKILSEGSESRNNHRYAVVVQDLATQWLQSHPFKKKLLRRPRRAQ